MSDVDGRWNLEIETIRGKRTLTCTVDGDTISGTIDGPKQKLATCKGSRTASASPPRA